MEFDPKLPPREFQVGQATKVTLRDCGSLKLGADEQVTFTTPGGGEYDVTRKIWGFYATPSINARLSGFGLKTALVRNALGRCFILLVEQGKEAEFTAYASGESLRVLCWLDDAASIERIEKLFREENEDA